MNLKKLMRENRKGSYLVEATLTLPVFILGVTAIAMIINIMAICESVCFVTSREVKEFSRFSNKIISSVSLSKSIVSGLEEEWQTLPPLSDFKVKNIRTGFQSGNLDDLISVRTEASFSVDNPIGIRGGITFTEKLIARSFSGTAQDALPLDEAVFTETGKSFDVAVYPKYGERFHKLSCTIVQQEEKDGNQGWVMDLEEAKRQDYTPCMICGGGL